jgi:hypothetical protein
LTEKVAVKVGVMPRADTRKSRSTGEPDALKGACPVREGAVGNLRKPVVPYSGPRKLDSRDNY